MTERDPLDEFEKALFEVARREGPSNEVRSRVRDAARGSGLGSVLHGDAHVRERAGARSRRSLLAALALAAVVALAFALLLHDRRAPALDISAEGASAQRFPLAPEEHAAPFAVPSTAPSARELELEPSTRRAPRRASARSSAEAHGATPVPAPRASASLAEEIASLDRARTALTAGDTAQALRTLDEYDQVLRGTTLNAEATLLRIEALARSGRAAQASELARRFVASNPGSPLAERARRFMEFTGEGVE